MNKGLLCALTDQLADFQESCSTFERNPQELEKYRRQFQKEVDEKYATYDWEEVFLSSKFRKPEKSHYPKYKSARRTHRLNFKNSAKNDKVGLVGMSACLIYLIAANYKDFLNSTLEKGVLVGMVVLFLVIGTFTYRSFFMKLETKISIRRHGIEYFGNHVNWQDIVDFGVVNEGKSGFVMVLGTITKGIVEIRLTSLNLSPQDFTDIILLNAKYAKEKYS
ncbi:hypothetical protein POV27_06770 [Aureisphaera galaxeae]|uniref:hypothetical protein n=1 Tax=Aureisphaera galaxeae TaxID=1538023 RepID=UPI00234FF1D1|nr:hypothetical protein [Aureisphaera galaxeae]MDC8003747.1 hypothetical protein [Aureisphaera galaxeae]